MRCPFCGGIGSKVTDTRTVLEPNTIRRRRMCEKCGERFTTYERIESIPIIVVKSDKTREPFERTKLLNGIMLACKKRPVGIEQMEELVHSVELTIENSMKKEIESSEIGCIVMEKLKALDQVAYVRFASVYRKFADIDSFVHELGVLLKEKNAGVNL